MYDSLVKINVSVMKFPKMPSKEEIPKVVGRSARFRPIHAVEKDSTSARRSLFGPVDHEENALVLAELSDQLNQQARIRWNFDFLNCAPLLGRYDWSDPEATDDREPAAADDVNERVSDVRSGVEMVEDANVGLNDGKTRVCDNTSTSLAASSSSPNYVFMKRQSRKIIRRLTWAPKKKTGFLSRSSRRAVRDATIPDYYPVRKRLEF